MKKISAAAAALMLVFTMTMTAFAVNANAVPDDKNIDVQAVYVGEFDNVTVGTIGPGDPIPLPDGGKIKIDTDNENDVGLRYVITIITEDEPEAYDYVSGAVGEIGSDIYAVHIAFYKDDERVEPSGNVTISMTAPNGYDNAEFVYITDDTQLVELDREKVGEDIVFSTDKGGYYVLVNEEESSLPDSSSDDGDSSSDISSDSETDSTSDSSDGSGASETGSDSSDSASSDNTSSESSNSQSSSSAASSTSGTSGTNTTNPNTGAAVGTGIALIGGLAIVFVKGKRDKDE